MIFHMLRITLDLKSFRNSFGKLINRNCFESIRRLISSLGLFC
ncbi:hypothetical protein F383_38077 [Gossypium arboreum]|uniref:Uncharacterized protein n=1 Tax=Gossypium arboreum TaxID=29729 RepID=A0A0B0MHD7_GOSAR|nr:hypothetical protein F383_38077 [Gossypium arboreum]